MSDYEEGHHHHHHREEEEEKHHRREEKHHHKEEKHHHNEERERYGGDYNQGYNQGGYNEGYNRGPSQGYNQGPYGSQPAPSAHGGGYGGPPQSGYPAQYETQTTVVVQDTSQVDPEKRAALEKAQKRNEHLAEFGALASGAFALYEQHQTKVDPQNAQRHRIEEAIAGAATLGTGGYAVYEHHQVSTEKKEDAKAHPEQQKHHGFFG